MHLTAATSRGQGRAELYAEEEEAFPPAWLCACLCLVKSEDARVIYLPNVVRVIFHSYVSDRGLSSHYWNDNSSFPQSRGGGGGGNFPSPTLSSLLPPHLPSFSQHMDAGVPLMFSRCLSSASALTKKKNYVFSSNRSHLLSLSLMHTLTHSLLQLTVLLKRHFLGPADFLDIIL